MASKHDHFEYDPYFDTPENLTANREWEDHYRMLVRKAYDDFDSLRAAAAQSLELGSGGAIAKRPPSFLGMLEGVKSDPEEAVRLMHAYQKAALQTTRDLLYARWRETS